MKFPWRRIEANQSTILLRKVIMPLPTPLNVRLLSDNNSSRYRQLEWPIRKENIQPMQAARSALPHEKSSLGSGPPSCVLWRKKLRVTVFTRHPLVKRRSEVESLRSRSNANCPHSDSSDT